MKKYRYKKSYRAKKRKSIIRLILYSRLFWLSCLVLIILGVIFYFVVFSSFFQIEEIRITGNKKVSTENLKSIIICQINKKIVFFISKSIFLANLPEASREILEEFPQITEADLKRDFPDVITVKIEEREAIGVWCQPRTFNAESIESIENNTEKVQGQDSNFFYIDKEGIIFEKISESEINAQILMVKNLASIEDLQLGKKVIEKEQLNQILKIESKLKNDLKVPFREISIISEKRLNTKTTEGWEIYFNPKKDIDWQLSELDFLLKEKIPPDKRRNLEYVDLRFEKIYIYPENYNQ